MSDYFDEVADMLAASRTVGPYTTREVIIDSLRRKFATEDALRSFVQETMGIVREEFKNPDAALLVPPLPGETEWELLTRGPDDKQH